MPTLTTSTRPPLGRGQHRAYEDPAREARHRAAADNTYYQLTAAASASGYLLCGQEDFRALQYLDFVNTMSYDYHGSWNNYVGPQAPLYDDGKDVELAATGIYDKANLGVPVLHARLEGRPGG
ncbi:glycosyl hydrolase family 18 protein [Streptomyces sp. NPDC059477]|uniref:glycosyl hydrolase family 18 protein n=1 Tax=Streptomyces sp. NPDC059477 TaxID=3346847 RepID=UPI003685F308